MGKEEAMMRYLELINDLIVEEKIFTSDENAGFDATLQEILTLCNQYQLLRKQQRFNHHTKSEEKEESSLFQPGSEVFLENRNSLLETVQDLVQHDIVESNLEKQPYSLQEDPLNVMEPRPTKNYSEESLVRNNKSFGEVLDQLSDLNKRVDILEARVKLLFPPSPQDIIQKLTSYCIEKLRSRYLKALAGLSVLGIVIKILLRFKKRI